MKPVEFVLWLNGAAELVGDQPPTPEQWVTMREKLGEVVGGLVAARLLERAEETLRADEHRVAVKQMFGLAHAGPPGAIFEVTELPKVQSPGFLNRILGKAGT